MLAPPAVFVTLAVWLGLAFFFDWWPFVERRPTAYYPYLATSSDHATRALAKYKLPNGLMACPDLARLPGTRSPDEVGWCFTYPTRWLNIFLAGDHADYVYRVGSYHDGPTSVTQKRILVEATALAAGGLPKDVIRKLINSTGRTGPGTDGDHETFTTDRARATIQRAGDRDQGWSLTITPIDDEILQRWQDRPTRIDPERLARNFAPILHLAGDEKFQPLSLEALRGRAELCEKLGGRVNRSTCKQLEELPAQTPCGTERCEREWILDLPGAHEYKTPRQYFKIEDAIRDGPHKRPVVYWHMADMGFRRVLSYWIYYLYNDFANLHEGDWETVQVELAGARNDNQVGAQRWFFSSHQGGETEPCSQFPSNCRHPDVYVALGSHANYFTPGEHPVFVCPSGHCIKMSKPDATETSDEPLEPGDYQLVELKEPPYMGRYGRENLPADWRPTPIPFWDRNAPGDPRVRPEWSRQPLARFEAAVGPAPGARTFTIVELDP